MLTALLHRSALLLTISFTREISRLETEAILV